MKYKLQYFLTLILLSTVSNVKAQTNSKIDVWLTNRDKSALFTRQDKQLQFGSATNDNPVIKVDDKQTYQSMVGFGFALTGGSAMHIINMNAGSRLKLLQEVFGTKGNDIGVSYLRLSIGSSDLNDHVFSYDDLPDGETDINMDKFDLGPDKKDVIPVMKEILALNPSIKILGSPWSPPKWMKTNNDTRGGRLKPEYYAAYAKYFVKYIKQMKAKGITIDAITVQNEPLHPGNNPSLLLTGPEEKDFIKYNLGPAFKAAGIQTKILIYDHNADRPDYPITILDDPQAAKYIDGSAFHLYGGSVDAFTQVHNAHPDKNIYFTEQMVVQFHDTSRMIISEPVGTIIIGATRNWCRNVLEWNLAAGPDFKPYTDRGGCSMCQGAVTIDGNSYSKNIAYYSMAHISKFVRPGSVRIASNDLESLPNVAFTTPGNKKVLIVANENNKPQTFTISYHGKNASATLEGKAVATFVW
ncbi:glucosylceramidase [Ginsengibacter hankyongi]|uniref:Glucosylceramidase n=1 Tax=Ginsengibacter hankyongi TaxID=2607284 RepID=A0A5J5IHQ0_9BACT|nr:glycoside hydrolase family 30 beta sandwich domain-containing protein [Ginsengibacter hankyongi]KAA9039098.1 glucosylceramidase [Ginsengibacter hankyongi]